MRENIILISLLGLLLMSGCADTGYILLTEDVNLSDLNVDLNNYWYEINTPLGSNVLPKTPFDTLNLTSTGGTISITGDNGTETINIEAIGGGTIDTNAQTACANGYFLDGSGSCVENTFISSYIDTNAQTACGLYELLDGNGICRPFSDFNQGFSGYIPTEADIDANALEVINSLDLNNSLDYSKIDTNAQTACAAGELLLGNGSCTTYLPNVDQDLFNRVNIDGGGYYTVNTPTDTLGFIGAGSVSLGQVSSGTGTEITITGTDTNIPNIIEVGTTTGQLATWADNNSIWEDRPPNELFFDLTTKALQIGIPAMPLMDLTSKLILYNSLGNTSARIIGDPTGQAGLIFSDTTGALSDMWYDATTDDFTIRADDKLIVQTGEDVQYTVTTGDFDITTAQTGNDITYHHTTTSSSGSTRGMILNKVYAGTHATGAAIGYAGQLNGTNYGDIFIQKEAAGIGGIETNLQTAVGARRVTQVSGINESFAVSGVGSTLNPTAGTLVTTQDDADAPKPPFYAEQDNYNGNIEVEYLKQDDINAEFTDYDGTLSVTCGDNILLDAFGAVQPTEYYVKISSPDIPICTAPTHCYFRVHNCVYEEDPPK